MGLFSGIFQRRALDLQTGYGLAARNGLGLYESATGVTVTPLKALQSTAVFGCVRVLSETVASLPLFINKRLERGKTRAPEHYLYPGAA